MQCATLALLRGLSRLAALLNANDVLRCMLACIHVSVMRSRELILPGRMVVA
jgi:hypothetical protein